MNTDNSQKTPNDQNDQNYPASGISKEKEIARPVDNSTVIKEIGQEQGISVEATNAGVVQKTESIEIPPDIRSLGVRPTGIQTPVPAKPTLKLPLPDEKIAEGRHASILSSVRWLSEWCFFQLKRLHLTLKVIHGKVMRIRTKN